MTHRHADLGTHLAESRGRELAGCPFDAWCRILSGRFKVLDSQQRALVSSILRSPLPFSLSFFLLLSASRPGREEKMRGSRSFIPRGGVNYLAARSSSSARERAGTHALNRIAHACDERSSALGDVSEINVSGPCHLTRASSGAFFLKRKENPH